MLRCPDLESLKNNNVTKYLCCQNKGNYVPCSLVPLLLLNKAFLKKLSGKLFSVFTLTGISIFLLTFLFFPTCGGRSYSLFISPLTAQAAQKSLTQKKDINNNIKVTSNNKEKEITNSNKNNENNEQADFESLLQKELDGIESDDAKKEKSEDVSWVWQITKTFLVLLFLIGFFWGGWRLYLFKKELPFKESEVMQVLYEYDLSGSRRISIVQLVNRLLVLGISESGIQLITEITDKHTIDQIKLDCEKDKKNEKPDFLWELTKVIKNKVSGWTSLSKTETHTNKASNQNIQDWGQLRQNSKNRLQQLKKQKDDFSSYFQADEL